MGNVVMNRFTVWSVWCPKCEARQGHPCKSIVTGQWYGKEFIHKARRDFYQVKLKEKEQKRVQPR